MLNVIAIIVSKVTSHCKGTVQMREESESGIRKLKESEKRCDLRRQQKMEREGGSSDVLRTTYCIAAKTAPPKILRLEWPWPRNHTAYSYSRRGNFGGSVLWLNNTSYSKSV